MSKFVRQGIYLVALVAPLLAQGRNANASAEMPEGQIPPQYVHVPGGTAVHSSCVHEVPDGSHIDLNGDVHHRGAVIKRITKCEHPRYGTAAPNSEAAIPIVLNTTHPFSWFEFDPTSSNNSYHSTWASYLQSSWIVPPLPASTTGPWFALWIGLQDGTFAYDNSKSGSTSLIQSVLAYNVRPYPPQGGSGPSIPGYSISSWWVWVTDATKKDAAGEAYIYSTPHAVRPGTTVTGYVGALSCLQNQGAPCDWIVETDASDGQYTYFTMSSRVAMTRVLAGVLEFPAVKACSDFPGGSGGSTKFTNTLVTVGTTSNLNNLVTFGSGGSIWDYHISPNPPWGSTVRYPSCNFATSSAAQGLYSTLTVRY